MYPTRNAGWPASEPSGASASAVRPFTSNTETNTFGTSAAVIGTSTVSCVDEIANCRYWRTPSRSIVSSAVACSHGDWIMTRADSPGFQVSRSGTSVILFPSIRHDEAPPPMP